MKHLLTPSQSATLIAKGISADKASERTLDFCDIITPLERRELLPIFTLADLLALLPKVINNGNFYLDFSYGYGDWTASYILWDDCDEGTYIRDTQGEKTAKELVDALYELLLWCLYNNHVKLD